MCVVPVTLPGPKELRHLKSTRDVLAAPLKPVVRSSLLDDSRKRLNEEWYAEGSDEEELVDAVEVRGYRSACSRHD